MTKEDPDYKDYVKPELIKDFEKSCKINSLDFYGCGCVLTAHIVMKRLMAHTFDKTWKERKCNPKTAWFEAMAVMSDHSGASAAMTAIMIARYSPRGEEFKRWCKKHDVVGVKWK